MTWKFIDIDQAWDKEVVASSRLIDIQFDPALWCLTHLNYSPFDNQIEIIEKISDLNCKYIMIVAARSAGKCITGDSLILSEKGLIPIQEFAGQLKSQTEKPLVSTVYSKDGPVQTSVVLNEGLRETRKIVVQGGYTIEGTPHHPLLVLDRDCSLRFKKLSELAKGDYVCVQRGQNYWPTKQYSLQQVPISFKFSNKKYKIPSRSPIVVNEDFARVQAYLLAEGHTPGHYRMTFTNTNKEVLTDFFSSFSSCFGTSTFWKLSSKETTKDFYLSSSYVRDMLAVSGYKFGVSRVKEVPTSILRSPKEVVVAFLQAYFESEGSAYSSTIEVSSASEKLIKQLQILLLNFGIISFQMKEWKCATNGTKIKRPYWRLNIYGKSIHTFAKEIGFRSTEKKQILVDQIKRLNSGRSRVELAIPFAKDRVTSVLNSKKKQINYEERQQLRLWVQKEHLSRTRATALVEKDLPQFQWLKEVFNDQFVYLPVECITESSSIVYDFTVPEYHNFTSNGFISHNTDSVCAGLIKLCLENPGLGVGVFAPKAEQSTRLVRRCQDILKTSKEIDKIMWTTTTQSRVEFENKSFILAQSANEVSMTEGGHYDVLVVDEAQKVSDLSISQKMLPMIASSKVGKIIKLGVALYKNHFWRSFNDQQYEHLIYDWSKCPNLLKGGSIVVRGKEYSKYVIDRMPFSIKQQVFPDNPELWVNTSDTTEIDFKTQYQIEWQDGIDKALTEQDQRMLSSGQHRWLSGGLITDTYFAGLDTAGGSANGSSSGDLDFTSLSIWRKTNNHTKEKVFHAEWKGDITQAINEIYELINPQTGRFKCQFTVVDYSNIGISLVESYKKLGVPLEGITFGTTERTSGKNYKNAMFDQFLFELRAGRVKYPGQDIDKTKILKKAQTEWGMLERHSMLGINAKIFVPESDGHDDTVMSDIMGIWAADKYTSFLKSNATAISFEMPSPMSVNSVLNPQFNTPSNPSWLQEFGK